MSFGLSVRNDSSYIQIDSETPRLCALYSGSYAASGSSNVTVNFPAPITTSEPPCIFIRNSPSQPDVLYMGMYVLGSAGNWTGFRIEAANVTWRPAGKWFVAVFASMSSASWGLRMWDANGAVIYDSGATPVIFTKASNSWSYQGQVTLTLGRAYYYRSGLIGGIASDEYFMINPFSRKQLTPQHEVSNTAGVRFNYAENRLQMYVLGTSAWTSMGSPGSVFARLPGT